MDTDWSVYYYDGYPVYRNSRTGQVVKAGAPLRRHTEREKVPARVDELDVRLAIWTMQGVLSE